MKKTLLLLLFPVIIFSQNLDYAKSLNNFETADEINAFSNELMSKFSVPMKIYGNYVNAEDNLVLIYYKADLPQDIIKADAEKNTCTLCTEIIFSKKYKNANADLEIKGTPYYSFTEISGKYLDLAKWWIIHFAPETTVEALLDKESNKRYIRDVESNVNIRFVKNSEGVWRIWNFN